MQQHGLMARDIPVQVWLLLLAGLIGFVPARAIWRHMTGPPARKDPRRVVDDPRLHWPGSLIANIAVVAEIILFCIFIFTPWAAHLAHAPFFAPLLFAGLGLWIVSSTLRDIAKGEIEPLARGFQWTFMRETQPKRFWASATWNLMLGGGMLWATFGWASQQLEDQCYDRRNRGTAHEEVAACDKLLAKQSAGSASYQSLIAARGAAYHRMEKYDAALADYNLAIKLDPKDSYSLYNRALVLEQRGRPAQAMHDYTASLKLRADNGDAYLKRGLLFMQVKRLDDAIADFGRAHDLMPADPWSLANRGIAYAWKKDIRRAKADLDAARLIDPDNQGVLQGEALTSLVMGDWREGVRQLTIAIKKDPQDRWSLAMRRDAYRMLNEAENMENDTSALMRMNGAAE